MKVNITEAEWPVVEVLWQEAPLSAREVYDRLPADKPDYRTIRTLLTRLTEKGALERTSKHGMLVFRPAVQRKGVVRQAAASFLQRFFGGQLEAGVAHFIGEKKLSLESIARIKRMLNEKEKELKS